MTYVLAVLSHGDPGSDTIKRCLQSFEQHVTPMPAFVCYHHDGPGRANPWIGGWNGAGFQIAQNGQQLGFCGASRALWTTAVSRARSLGVKHVFWLEHDFVFTENIDVDALAYVLGMRSGIAQLSLMRDAANDAERKAGGLFESRREQYRQRVAQRWTADGTIYYDWMEHSAYFTTTPSLMKTEFMDENPWPAFQSECEGRFGIELVKRGYTFGVWGHGRPSVEHIGRRTGKGY